VQVPILLLKWIAFANLMDITAIMKFNLKEQRVHIVWALIWALIIALFEPLLALFWRGIILFESSFFNRIYREAALGGIDWSYFLALCFLYIFVAYLPNRTQKPIRIMASAVIIFFFAVTYLENVTTTTFNQRLDIVTPYIQQHDRDLLVSHYRLIRNYDDYKQVLVRLDSIARVHNLSLPRNKVYLPY